jgi:hypothetical protein
MVNTTYGVVLPDTSNATAGGVTVVASTYAPSNTRKLKVETELHIDREIFARKMQRAQVNVIRALALPKEEHKKGTQMNVTRTLAT